MIRSKKILLMITALTATTTFSNNCFAMKNNNRLNKTNISRI